MANPNLRTFLAQAKAAGELAEVKDFVDPKFGASAILAKLEQQNKYPAVLYNKVGDSEYPVLSNIFAARSRIAMALGCDEKNLNAFYRSREDARIKPVMVEEAPVQEIVWTGDDVHLARLPVLTHNELDAGPYITCGAGVTREKKTGIRNIGVYRHQVHSKTKLGIHLAEVSNVNYIFSGYESVGEDMPIAITIGHHPAFYLGCLSFVPLGIDEYDVVGGLMGEPLELVKCKTVPLEVPAHAEIVIEGFISAKERHPEAPFGEFTTCYGAQHDYPVINVTAITMRKEPIYLDCFSGHGDHQLMGGIGRLSIIYKTIRMACPTVQDVNMPISGCCRLTCYVSIKKRHEGESKNVISAVFASDPFVKYVVVVDDDVNIFNDAEVWKAIATRLKPEQNAFMMKNAKGHPLDPTASEGYVVTKVGIDATKPLTGFPDTVSVPGTADIDLDKVLVYL